MRGTRNYTIGRLGMMCLICLLGGGCATFNPFPASGVHNVRSYGAKGDGTTLDTAAINSAIEHAAAHGGGTVFFPPGTYLTYSIRLKSNITLDISQGATVLAAESPHDEAFDKYDAPEPNASDHYQDFGHTHWHNSLIWGENLENVSIVGQGMIDGKGLSRGQRPPAPGTVPPVLPPVDPKLATTWPSPLPGPATTSNTLPWGANQQYPNERDSLPAGIGNKAIALKLCRNVIIRDVTIYRGGHFGILATGVDNMTIANLKIDTNRDGIDIDCCQNVRVSDCTVNSPYDDGICPKSSYALGYARATENVTITNCQVSGYETGTLLDGTFQRNPQREYWRGGPTGRIKFGTESNGGFKNITISNCVFSYCRGLALESVDGSLLEDVTISNITMRDVWSSVFFIRLGARMRGPEGTPIGTLKRVHIDNVVAYNASPIYSSIISGVPGGIIEDLRLSNIRIVYQGGGPKELATSQPSEMEKEYPEPRMFGHIPAYGFFIRHVKGLQMENIQISYMDRDERPAFILEDVDGADFEKINAEHESGVPVFQMQNVKDFRARDVRGMNDVQKDSVTQDHF